jgi:hypothetical protein
VFFGNALISAERKRIDVTCVTFGEQVSDVMTLIVPSLSNRLRSSHGVHAQPRRVNGEPFINEHIDVAWMVD